MGYGEQQMEELEETIDALATPTSCSIGTPIDLRRVVDIDKPAVRVTLRARGDRRSRRSTEHPRSSAASSSSRAPGRKRFGSGSPRVTKMRA